MSRPVKGEGGRRYNATRRQAAARLTRRAILEAARPLFLDRGYAGTTMAAIAKAAGVSIETLYLSVGPKAAIVRHLVELALSGTEEPVPGPEREWVKGFVAEPDPRLKLRLHAAPAIRRLHERLAPIWSVVVEAAPGDTDLRALVDELEQRRLHDMRLMAQHLADSGALRRDLTVEMTADILWVTNATEFHELLARRGWGPDVTEGFLADAWIRLLLSAGPPG